MKKTGKPIKIDLPYEDAVKAFMRTPPPKKQRRIRVGDRVKLIGIPPGTRNLKGLPTLTLFKKCLGRTFKVKDVERVEGLKRPLARLEVGHVVSRKSTHEVIWVEPEFLEIVG